MSAAREGSGGSGGLSSHEQHLSSPTSAPSKQTTTSSLLYLSTAVAEGGGGGSNSQASSPTDSNHIASSSGGQQQQQDPALDYSPVPSQWTAIGSSAAASNSSEDFFFQRDPLLLPRRNHTIGAGPITSNRRRLNSHFQFPSQATTSPGQNSLSAITGGQDVDDDDWESMIKSRDRLVPDDDEGDEAAIKGLDNGRIAAAPSAWQPDSSIFTTSHHRFSSQPSSAQAATPYYSGTQSPVTSSDSNNNGLGHQRSESAHVRSLEQGPFASASTVTSHTSRYSNVDIGMIRRHQSLNHATGRATANRLQSSTRRSNEKQSGIYRNPVDFFDHSSSHQSISPGVPPIVSGRATPESIDPLQSSSIPSSTIQDAYARLSRMTLQPSQTIRESSIDSNATANGNDAQKRLPSLVTNRELLERSAITSIQGIKNYIGPASAAAYVPPIGHGHHRHDSASSNAAHPKSDAPRHETSTLQGPHSAMPASNAWKTSHQTNLGQSLLLADPAWNKQVQLTPLDNTAMSIAILQQRLLQQNPASFQLSTAQQIQQQQALHNSMHSAAAMAFIPGNQAFSLDSRQNITSVSSHHSTFPVESAPPVFRGYPTAPFLGQPLAPLATSTPAISPALASLIAARGYNPTPTQFDLNPLRARFFVIKSFTEDDVQRSLKYEIWASTDKGNQRLDKAYKECQEEGNIPLYLFFSVNASGHFCGMAQMMTALDYNSSSNVWVQEGKWKGTFKVRWIYVKDVPNVKLRHICLINTPERKPITQSRDTQELPTDGGKEVLKIMAEYQSKTTLLQDWLFYEQQAIQQQQQRKDNEESTTATASNE